MTSAGQLEAKALRATVGLVDYLSDLTDSSARKPLRDIINDQSGAIEKLLWIEEFPPGISLDPDSDDLLLIIHPIPKTSPPKLPNELVGWVDPSSIRKVDGPEPKLRDDSERSPITDQPDASIGRAFDGWLRQWRSWAEEERLLVHRRALYESLEAAAKSMEQRDDEYEFVLAIGLVTVPAEGDSRCRHLLTEQVLPTLDRTGTIRLSRPGKRRIEDREIFEGLDVYHPDRGKTAKAELQIADESVLTTKTIDGMREWLGLAIDEIFELEETRSQPSDFVSNPRFAPAPALILRRRSQERIAEAYRRIGEALRQPGAEVPVALAQIVVDTERVDRERWLDQQGAVRGDVLGHDPLFPLATNDEQLRVLDLLRTEIGVVVQGPPGTGKTHTIANLISALLAQGQRVLVTSQKDQALRVLRDKIPPELRHLCVLLTGGSKDASVELQQGLDALSTAIASTDASSLAAEARRLSDRRIELKARNVVLNAEISDLRSDESRVYEPVVAGCSDRYRGTLSEIVHDVKADAVSHDWMPQVPESAGDSPPLSPSEWTELRRLLIDGLLPDRRPHAAQVLPPASELPSVAELTNLVAAERESATDVGTELDEHAALLGRLTDDDLSQLRLASNHMWELLHRYGLAAQVSPGCQWVARAVDDRLGGRNVGLWTGPLQSMHEPSRLLSALNAINAAGYVIDLRAPISYQYLGAARACLQGGSALLAFLDGGGKLKTRFASKPQKDAQPFLDLVVVDGRAPDSPETLRAALDRVHAEISAIQLSRSWFESGIPVAAGVQFAAQANQILHELAEHARMLGAIGEIHQARDRIAEIVGRYSIPLPLYDIASIRMVLQSVSGAEKHAQLTRAKRRIEQVRTDITALASAPNACIELTHAVDAVSRRDVQQYAQVIESLDGLRTQQIREQRAIQLERMLSDTHPRLLTLLHTTYADPVWEDRDIAAAWAWSKAQRFVGLRRTAEHEHELLDEYEANESEIKILSARLVAIEAQAACLRRLTDDQQRALNAYRTHMSKIGAGTGRKTREFRKAARAAMTKAQDAVPAWVVPLPNLLDNIEADRNRFDVVIVDEASQVGIEHLYLLWMAPRVIVVGDDKQCTPGSSTLGLLDQVFARNDEHLAEVDADIRTILTPRSNLYEVLSARSGKDALVRLREHFRCVPEIINWSSRQFYDDGSGRGGLIPLRERRHDALPPLRVTKVEGGYTEGRDIRRRNPIEAKMLVDTLVRCLDDPAYERKTFGIVVLQSMKSHIQLLENLVNESISPEVREIRQIRVGTAPNFQGDERDVIFLSMVVADSPRMISSEIYRQAYNVAATRAKDQLWLFISVGQDQLRPGCLRASLLGYMLDPPSVFGDSLSVDEVSEHKRTPPFESLFEQRVFRILRSRGYHVVPQYPVGSRRLDLVVVGDNGRIAVECDGHYWHTDVSAQANDARRDRELFRMGWTTIRIRESEFEFDPEQAMIPVWKALQDKGIMPGTIDGDSRAPWQPSTLADEDESDEEGTLP
ncbi:AAA family ATPase [Nocardia sp. ET3-3]|uniref:AAA family ATPase n=1 Tax=Nocardia terrae TaxID=2675851 RepID=A0A7K1V6M2_9NOCA|nr:AAA domain-containing protein [Nocardia terrae]MVU82294.1 AAA family ATPase [Nocardia terrae]